MSLAPSSSAVAGCASGETDAAPAGKGSFVVGGRGAGMRRIGPARPFGPDFAVRRTRAPAH